MPRTFSTKNCSSMCGVCRSPHPRAANRRIAASTRVATSATRVGDMKARGIIPSAVELLTALALTATLAAPSPASRKAAEALARRVEQRHRTVTDLTARFVQTYRSGPIGREVVEKGVVSIKRPGRMLWEYRDPEKKTFVADGKSFFFYVPADKQVIVRSQARDKSIPAQLLSGQSDLLADFEPALESAP